MGGRIRILLCLAVGALALLAAGPALAQGSGTTTSAGDQQYVDPLSTNTSATPAPKTSTTTAAPPVASAPTTPAPTPAPAPAAQPVATPSASTNTLPYTGLNLGLLIAVGLGLLGGGLVLLRLARRPGPRA